MTVVEVEDGAVPAVATDTRPSPPGARRPPVDLQRTFRLVLATIWLLDAALQLQPVMFTRGSGGFSGMLSGVAAGNPGFLYHSVTWNASNVYHHPVLSNTIFASIQFLIAFGIVYRRTCRPALVLSIVWAVGVWWFGEGAGEIFQGGATPFAGGPGGVLFYAVLAVLLWPCEGSDRPFVAARTVGVTAAKVIWAVVWGLLAVLSLVGSGRSPQALRDLVATLDVGQPGWLAHIDRSTESLLVHHGSSVAVVLAVVCLVVAAGVFARPPVAQAAMVLAMVVFALIWFAVQDFGGILAGGATDPNSGPLIILLALIYWPLTTTGAATDSPGPVSRPVTGKA
jgi:hypothetical protein